MKHFLPVIISLLCVACSVQKQVTPTESTRVETRTETVFQKDTVYLEIPVIQEKVQTLDTVSVLENKYAKSEASVANGVLTHSLATKPVNEPRIVDTKVVYKDSLVYVDRVMKETVEVEKKQSWWDQLIHSLGYSFLGMFLGLLDWAIWYAIKTIIRK